MLTRATTTIYADKNIRLCDILTMFHVGHLVQILRKREELTVEQLAARAEVNKGTIIRIEKNRYKPASLKKIAGALKVTPAELLLRAERMNAAYYQPLQGQGPCAGSSELQRIFCGDELHKDLHLMFEDILHGPDFWRRGIQANIVGLWMSRTGRKPKPSIMALLKPEKPGGARTGDRMRTTRTKP